MAKFQIKELIVGVFDEIIFFYEKVLARIRMARPLSSFYGPFRNGRFFSSHCLFFLQDACWLLDQNSFLVGRNFFWFRLSFEGLQRHPFKKLMADFLFQERITRTFNTYLL